MEYIKKIRDINIRRLFERFLFLSGLIGLIGIDQDVLRWSALVHWVVGIYRVVADHTREFLMQWLSVSISPDVINLVYLTSVFLAAANAYSFRRYGMFTFAYALRLLILEQVLRKSSDHLWKDPTSAKERKAIASASATLAIFLAYLFLGNLCFYSRSIDPRLWWQDLCFPLYFLGGFSLLASLDEQVPQNATSRFKTKTYRILLSAYFVFLPVTLVRFVSFFIPTLLFSVFMAWRWYIVFFLVLFGVIAMNELYYQFVYDWNNQKPVCTIFSIRPLCPNARL